MVTGLLAVLIIVNQYGLSQSVATGGRHCGVRTRFKFHFLFPIYVILVKSLHLPKL